PADHCSRASAPTPRLPSLPRGKGPALPEHPPCCSFLAARALTEPDSSSGAPGRRHSRPALVSVISVVLLAFLKGIQPWASIPGSPYKCNRDLPHDEAVGFTLHGAPSTAWRKYHT